MANIQTLLAGHFFPKDRERLNQVLAPVTGLADLSDDEIVARREECIRRTRIYINGSGPLGEQAYNLIYAKNGQLPEIPFRDLVIQCKPYLASNAAWREWWAMEPADRWYALTGVEEER